MFTLLFAPKFVSAVCYSGMECGLASASQLSSSYGGVLHCFHVGNLSFFRVKNKARDKFGADEAGWFRVVTRRRLVAPR